MSEFSVLIERYIREKQEAKGVAFCAASWLDSAAKRASQISIATHVLKYTHSDAKGTNINLMATTNSKENPFQYVSTCTLKNVRRDVVGNAAAMDIAGLLSIEVNGDTFLDLISRDDFSAMDSFAESKEQLSVWMKGFKAILSNQGLSSHTLAKQIYFPQEKGNYHLLAPLYATSLAHALYDRVKEDRFGESAKAARESKKKGEYSDKILIDYPNLAIQTFGGTKPQNISRLNSLRGGKSYLLRSAPPVWVTLKKPPLKKGAFWRAYEARVKVSLRDFKQFLWAVRNKDSTKDIRIKIGVYVDQFIDSLMCLSTEIQAMPPGWSYDSKLYLYEQIWLDPNREDIIEIRSHNEWKEEVASHFATWLIQKCESKVLKFNDVNHEYLCGQCLEVLKGVE
jgi:CRISPR-associated protein Csy1